MITDQQLADFFFFFDALRAEYFAANGLSVSAGMEEPVTFQRGPKYARIVLTNGPSRSVHCFVNLSNGDILKAAGWKAPYKGGARGNIANGAADVSPHGAAYAR